MLTHGSICACAACDPYEPESCYDTSMNIEGYATGIVRHTALVKVTHPRLRLTAKVPQVVTETYNLNDEIEKKIFAKLFEKRMPGYEFEVKN